MLLKLFVSSWKCIWWGCDLTVVDEDDIHMYCSSVITAATSRDANHYDLGVIIMQFGPLLRLRLP